ncbi:MAG: efflux RND transporter periplasmic adaptor subunit [Pseudomonadota bacterium]
MSIRLWGLVCLGVIGSVQAAVPVSTAVLGELVTPQVFSAPAQVKPLNRPQVAAEVSGQILRLLVQVGEVVAADAVLVELDCRTHQAQVQAAGAALQRAQAQLRFARSQLQRAQNLRRKGSVSNEVLEQRRLAVNTASADVQAQQVQQDLAQLSVQHCQIRAPFAALVSQRLGSVGGYATPGTPLLELVQLDQREVRAELRPSAVAALRAGQAMRFRYQEQDYPVQLRTLLPLVDERTRTREARLLFSTAERVADIGAAGRLIWHSTQPVLAAHYLVRRDGQLGIFVAQQGQARFIALAQAQEGQPVVVDLPPETVLIVAGRQRLQDGDTIQVTP